AIATGSARRRRRKPENFTFSSFHSHGRESRRGTFMMLTQTDRKGWRNKLKEVKAELRRRMRPATAVVADVLPNIPAASSQKSLADWMVWFAETDCYRELT